MVKKWGSDCFSVSFNCRFSNGVVFFATPCINVYQEHSKNGIPYLRTAALVFADFKIHLNAPLDFSAIFEAFTTYLILTLEFLHEIRSELLRHQG